MAEGWGPTAGNAALTALIGSYTWVKLHTGAPGAAGTSNAATNTTRAQVTFGSVSGGAVTSTADTTWTAVSTTETYTHWSLWTASSAGTFGASGTITGGAVTAGNDFKFPTGDFDLSVPLAS